MEEEFAIVRGFIFVVAKWDGWQGDRSFGGFALALDLVVLWLVTIIISLLSAKVNYK